VSFTAQCRMVFAGRHLAAVAGLEARYPTPPPWSSPASASPWRCTDGALWNSRTRDHRAHGPQATLGKRAASSRRSLHDTNLVFCHENGDHYTSDQLNWRFSK
jgi:hypothetical protein